MLEELGRYSENNRLEAKAAKSGLPKSIWETYSAFANTAGGVILLGVEERDDHSLHAVGVEDARKIRDDFWNTVNNRQHASVTVVSEDDVQVVKLEGGIEIVRIDVPRADRRAKPVYLHGNPLHCYRRNFTGDYKCSEDEVRSMMRDADAESQDAKPLSRVRMDELCQDTVRSYRTLYDSSHRGHPWVKLSDEEFLRAIGAAAEADDGKLHPTGAGLIMFGWDWRISEEYPDYFLDYRQQFDVTERWQNRVISQGGDWSGNAFDFYYRVYNLAKQALKVPFKLEGIYRVDDTPAHRALREALANCLTNANYRERRGVVVLWEPDKITIANPGDFRVDLEAAKLGGESDPRNRSMLRIFSFVNIGERAGSGVPKIIDGWTSCGYAAPTWVERFGPDRTVLTLPLVAAGEPGKKADGVAGAGESQGGYVGLRRGEAEALRLAEEAGRVTPKSLAEGAGITRRTASTTLKRLAEAGALVWHGKSAQDPRQYYDLG